ncbi:MAG: glycoside hydrolase family 88 protein [Bacteroidales bacterium]
MNIRLTFRLVGFIRKYLFLPAFLVGIHSCTPPPPDMDNLDLEAIDEQVIILEGSVENVHFENTLKGESKHKIMPRTIDEDGFLKLVKPDDWTAGFFPGILWYMYDLTGYDSWIEKALEYTVLMKEEMYNASSHDVGFKMFCSYGNALRVTGDTSFIPILVQSAKTLLTRYNDNVGCIRSWDFNQDKWEYPVIIDNMMNLELLFWATEQTGDSTYRRVAIRHANTTLENHFRPDFSSYHVVDYDSLTGAVRGKYTHQGFSPSSAWARGQSWGLYGYTMAYRYTKDPRYLAQAEGIAKFMLNNPRLPKDRIPLWDFDAPRLRKEPRDVSAAAIMSSAMYELSTYSDEGEYYKERADWIMEALSARPYRSPDGENFGFLLEHSTGALPEDSEVDVPLIYADYYYLEALVRRRTL